MILHTENNLIARGDIGIVPFHFDVADHSLPLNQFIDTARSAQAIVDNFNKEFFGDKIKYEVYVFTPEKGGLIEILGVGVTGFIAKTVWEFLESDIGKAYIKGLTDQEPVYWAEKAGKKTKEYLLDENGRVENPPKKDIPIAKEDQLTVSLILVQLILGFLKKEPGMLNKLGISKEKFRAAYSAKNRIYQVCINNPEVQGIGFDGSHDFPIKRKDFPRHIVDLPEETDKEWEDDFPWVVDIQDITVNSPNWKRDGRKWQAGTAKFKDIAFSIEDEMFWHHVRIKDIQPDINDNMRVQWAYPENAIRPSNVRVLKVLSYNGKKISNPLNAEQLKKELEKFSIVEKDLPDLFDPLPDSNIQVPNRKTG